MQIFPDNVYRREILNLDVACGLKGCKWIGKLKDLDVSMIYITTGCEWRLVLLPLWVRCLLVTKWLMNLISSDVTKPQALWLTMCI